MISIIISTILFLILLGAAAYIIYLTVIMKKERQEWKKKLYINTYVTDEDMQTLLQQLQDLLLVSQSAMCRKMQVLNIKALVDKTIYDFEQSMKDSGKNYSTCADMKQEIIIGMNGLIPDTEIELHVFKILNTITDMSCTDGKFDINKFKTIVNKSFTMFCPAQ